MVFGEALVGVADGADGFVGEILAAVDEVDDLVGLGVVEEAVDGEVAAGGVAGGVGFELDRLGMAAVEVGAIGTECRDFDAVPEDDAEVGADELSAGEEGSEFGGLGVGGDVEILGLAVEEVIADAAADQVGLVAVRVETRENLRHWGREDHPTPMVPQIGRYYGTCNA